MLTACARAVKARPMSALGQKQTHAMQQRMSALPPIATAKADICSALAHVCYWPIADIAVNDGLTVAARCRERKAQSSRHARSSASACFRARTESHQGKGRLKTLRQMPSLMHCRVLGGPH